MRGYEAAAAAGEGAIGPTKIRLMALKRNQLQKAYLDRWQATATDGKQPIDGIITAVTPWAAARLGVTQRNSYVGYTGVANLLGESVDRTIPNLNSTDVQEDLPACTFPVTFANKALDHSRHNYKPLNELDGSIQADYDPEFYDGAPVSLQLVGQRLEDEKLLEMVEVVASALREQDR